MTASLPAAFAAVLALATSPAFAQAKPPEPDAPAAASTALSPGAPEVPVVAPAHGLIPPPPPGKGQVVFFRGSSMVGGAVWFTVKEGGRKLGDLSLGAWFALPEEPGPHAFTAATENKDTLRLEVEAGETYYVRGSVRMGVLVGEATISPSDENAFEKSFKRLHPAKTWPAPEAASKTSPAG
jgi:hypothetical protein